MAEGGEVKYRVAADTASLKKSLDDANKSVEKVAKTSEQTGKTGEAAFNKMKLAALALKTAVVATAGKLLTAGIQYNAQMESYQASFETMLGSQEAAIKKLEELRIMAAETPFELSDLASATQTLLSFGVATDKVTGYMEMLGDVSQGNRDRFNSLTLAFAQVSSAGKLTGQDLLQMVNAGFNPLQEMTVMTGKSMSELRDEMSKGSISADDVAAAFQHATSEGGRFYNAMEKQSKTMSGQLATLRDNASMLLGSLTQGASNFISRTVLPALNNMLEKLNENADSAGKAIASFGVAAATAWAATKAWKAGESIKAMFDGLAGSITGALKALKQIEAAQGLAGVAAKALAGNLSVTQIVVGVLTGKIKLATAAQSLWNMAMSANPVGLLLTVVTALVGAIAIFCINAADATSETKKWAERTEELKNRQKELNDAVAQSASTYEETERNVLAQAEESELLIDKLEELSESYQGTANEQKAMGAIVARLNELNEGLNLSFNEQTGALSKTSSGLRAYVENVKQAALEQAKFQAMTEQYSISIEKRALADEARRAIDEYMESFKAGLLADGYTPERAEQIAQNNASTNRYVKDMQAVYDESIAAAEEAERFADEIAGVGEAADGAAESVENLSDAEQAAAEAAANAQKEQQLLRDVLSNTTQTMETVTQKVQEYADRAQDGFKQIDTASSVSLEQFRENLRANQEIMREWSDNLRELADRGINQGFLEMLRQAGPESASLVAEIAGLTDAELENVVAEWQQGGEDAAEAYSEEFDILLNDVPSAIGEAVARAISLAMEYGGDWEAIGKYYSDEFQSGVEPVIIPVEARVVGGGVASASAAIGASLSSGKITRKQFKSGIDFVPHDFMPAYLDYGERVLTKEQNAEYNALNGMSGLKRLEAIETRLAGMQGGRSLSLTVPLTVDGREIARASAYWTGEQLAWEEMH